MAPRMHDDEIESDPSLVRALLSEQLPQWADLPIARVVSTGTDNALYRIGDDLVGRFPLRPASVAPNEKQGSWLPVLGPQLPVNVPLPVARGEPSDAYAWPWWIYPWYHADTASTAPFEGAQLARDLARFIRALQRIDARDAPVPSMANFFRGIPLALRDGSTREAIEACASLVDTDAVVDAWEAALRVSEWDRPPVWIHGDIASGNLLVRDGRLAAVIDWGCLGAGDPACDYIVAWELLDARSRELFRKVLDVDDATWARARGWTVSTAVGALAYYEHTNPFMAAQARHKLKVVVDEGAQNKP